MVAANRDEFHARPAAPLAPWTDIAGVVGGRDLQADGAWFAVDAQRRVRHRHQLPRVRPPPPQRAVARRPDPRATSPGTRAPADYLRALETDAPGYAGFNLLLADRDSLWYASNRADQFARELPPGIYGLSNEFLDTPWPKLVRVRARFEAPAAIGRVRRSARRWPPTCSRCWPTARRRRPTALPPGDLSPEWARKLSAPFVLDPGYGTRCSTVLTISDDGALRDHRTPLRCRRRAAGTV